MTSAIVLTIFFLLTIRGSRFVTLFQNLVTVLLVVALIMFVVMGLPKVDAVKFFEDSYDGGFFHGGTAGLISAIAIADGYPFVSYLLVYIVALVPILTGMNVDSAISMLMIPTMLINAYLNVACMIIPRKYPEQFEKRALRIPRFIYDICSILGGVCALIIAVTLFKDLTVNDAIVAACVVILPLVFSWIALKVKSVDAEILAKARDEIIRDALQEEAA